MDTIVADCTKQNPPQESQSYGKHLAINTAGNGAGFAVIAGAIGGIVGPEGMVAGAVVGGIGGAVYGAVDGAINYPQWLEADKADKIKTAQKNTDTCIVKALRDTPKPPSF